MSLPLKRFALHSPPIVTQVKPEEERDIESHQLAVAGGFCVSHYRNQGATHYREVIESTSYGC